MSESLKLLELESALENIADHLASGSSIKQEYFDSLRVALVAALVETSNSPLISRKLALRLVEIYPAIYGHSAAYDEPDCSTVVAWAEDLLQEILKHL